ncbi:MAG: hypothetical protein KDE47_32480, partial [Caldilineaceae bacterium]|nr:hypothetical protein [Caldilineaceae bacterium]
MKRAYGIVGVLFLALMAIFVVVAVVAVRTFLNSSPAVDQAGGGVAAPDNAIEVSLVYAPEEELYILDAIREFNQAFAEGRNPVTGERLASGEQPIYVTGRSGSSGTVHQGIINAVIAPNNTNVEKPTIFSPSVSHWLALVN